MIREKSENNRLKTDELVHTTFLKRETGFYHHSYNEELLQYAYLRDGDMRAVDESIRMFRSGINGTLSKDPLRHVKYLFVASMTLATRFAIEGGMPEQDAYQISDLYIRKADLCDSVNAVNELQTTMFTDLTQRMGELHREAVNRGTSGKELSRAMDYIYDHLHEKLTASAVAKAAGLSPNYLNSVFKRETGKTLHKYILEKRIEAAKNMLLYSNYSQTEIAQFLAFSSVSHMIRVFKQLTGATPAAFIRENYRSIDVWRDQEALP